MTPDLTKLTQSELLRLMNGTPAGTVLTRSQLRRQMDAAGHRIGDGRIHLLKYIRWLILECDRPRPGPMDYLEAKRRQATRNRAATKAAQDIAPIPEVADVRRRAAACKDLRVFCETYFAATFWRPWSKDHLRAITKLDRAIRRGGLFAFAMPRGSGKTCLARTAALWAVLAGYRAFVCLIGGSQPRARELLRPLRKHILENPLLGADFPEAIYPLRCLDNSSKRQLAQHIRGKLTHVHWGDDRLVFPTVAEEDLPAALLAKRPAPLAKFTRSSGSIISITSLDANIRGQQHARADGTTVRPSLVVLDDPQTRQSARSIEQTRLRMALLKGDVLPMAGPGESISAMLTCTKIYDGDLADQILNREKNPEWQGECTKLLYAMPTNKALWRQYADLWAEGLRRGDEGRKAMGLYRDNQVEMDAGAIPAWPDRYDQAGGRELSAIQHAMNLKLRVGEEAFASEYQNEPVQEQVSDDRLTIEQVCAKTNGRKRGTVPRACTALTMFVDVHDRLLFWVVCGWEEDFTGYIVDYGTLPGQGRGFFTMRNARRTLGRAFPGKGVDGAIHAGLEQLVADYLQREWPRAGGGVMRVGRLMVDMRHKPGVIGAVKHKVGGEVMMLAMGVGIGAARRPMSQYHHKPGEKHGHHWYMPNVTGTREFPHVAVDVNYWKSFVHAGLAAPAGERGCLSLFGRSGRAHELFAEHIAASESWVETHGQGRDVREWRERPSKPDNHWFDALVGCAAAAAMLGAATPAMKAEPGRRRKRYTQADLRRRKD